MQWTEHQLEILREADRATALRDLNNTYGWQTYVKLAQERIDRMVEGYTRANLNPDQAWEAYMRLQSVLDFQRKMEEIVRTSVDLSDPMQIERLLYDLQVAREPEFPGE